MKTSQLTTALLITFISSTASVSAIDYPNGMYTYEQDGKIGFIHLTDTLTPAKYSDVGKEWWNGYVMVEVNEKTYGLVDLNGREVLPPVYDYLSRGENGKTVTVRNYNDSESDNMTTSLYTYDGIKGMYVKKEPATSTSPYDKVRIIGNETASISGWASGEIGMKRKDGKSIRSEKIVAGGEGEVPDVIGYHAEKDGKSYILSTDGKTILADVKDGYWYAFDRILVWHSDTLFVIGAKEQKITDIITSKITENAVELTHKNGKKEIIKKNKHLDSLNINSNFNKYSMALPVKENGKWGMYKNHLYASNGKIHNILSPEVVVPFEYERPADSHSEKYYFFSSSDIYNPNGINLTPKEFKGATHTLHRSDFTNYIIYEKEGVMGVVSVEGKVIIPLKYKNITNVNDEYFIVSNSNEQMGMISTDGKVLLPCIYDEIENNTKSELVIVKDKKEQYGLYNSKGEQLLPIEYDMITYIPEAYIYRDKKGMYGKITLAGEKHPSIYKQFKPISKYCYCFQDQNDKYGLIGPDGSIIQPFIYKNFENGFNSIYIVTDQNDKKGLVDEYGRLVVPCQYNDLVYDRGTKAFWSETGVAYRVYSNF